jgi:hypothetical protein
MKLKMGCAGVAKSGRDHGISTMLCFEHHQGIYVRMMFA